jgi:isopentenyl-diphosphate delta-isomerase
VAEGDIQQRKSDHLEIVAGQDVAHPVGSLLDEVTLVHNALPEIAFGLTNISCEFLGKRLSAPLLITSMTGGTRRGAELNRALASAANELGIAFAVGSQRVILRHPERMVDFSVRSQMPTGVLLGNIGGQQLIKQPPDVAMDLMYAIEADGMCIHLNPAHELAQDDGDRNFHKIIEAIAQLAQNIGDRLIVKETGAGLAPNVVQLLVEAGVRYVDVSGAGGTSWPRVESYRAQDPHCRAVAETYSGWGIPTAAATALARRTGGENLFVIGSGGVGTGLDVAKLIALGADLAGIARYVLLAYLQGGYQGLLDYLAGVIHELRAALLLTGCKNLGQLRSIPRVTGGRLREWLNAYENGPGTNRV